MLWFGQISIVVNAQILWPIWSHCLKPWWRWRRRRRDADLCDAFVTRRSVDRDLGRRTRPHVEGAWPVSRVQRRRRARSAPSGKAAAALKLRFHLIFLHSVLGRGTWITEWYHTWLWTVWLDNNRQMSIKVAQKWLHYKNEWFWHIYKNCLEMWAFWVK